MTEDLAEADDPNVEAVDAGPIARGMQVPEIRPVRPEELEDCARVWHASLNDYLVRLNQPEWPFDPNGITALYRHTQGTDPDRFLVAVRSEPTETDPAAERVVAFVSACVRDSHWFLSMLFVLPEEQASGIGRLLLERVLPPSGSGMTLATATDSAQPISNALYSRFGMIPRMPLLNLSGTLRQPATLPALPAGVTAITFEDVVASAANGTGHRDLAELVNALDRATLGVEHPQDHAWLRISGRRGFVYRDAHGAVLGYGYGSELGRIGPIAVREPDIMAPILGHLLATFQPRGAFAVWTPGAAGACVRLLLDAGLRLEPFPILMCWDEPVTDYTRYLPISPGLL